MARRHEKSDVHFYGIQFKNLFEPRVTNFGVFFWFAYFCLRNVLGEELKSLWQSYNIICTQKTPQLRFRSLERRTQGPSAKLQLVPGVAEGLQEHFCKGLNFSRPRALASSAVPFPAKEMEQGLGLGACSLAGRQGRSNGLNPPP